MAGGGVNEFFQTVVPIWNPLHWSSWNLSAVWHDIFGSGAFIGAPALRTLIYTAIATVISLAIAYPVAYFVSRYAGKRKTLFLVLLIAPFWVSYMMRMLAWIDLLQQGGLFNSALSFVGLPGNTDWLGGKSVTVILGLVYGYIPYVILVLYAFLDRIDQSLLEAARDLGLEQVADVLARDASPEQAGADRRDVHHGAADARRLLHQSAAVGSTRDDDDRQRDRGTARLAGRGRPGRRAGADAARRPADPDDLLRGQHRPRLDGRTPDG